MRTGRFPAAAMVVMLCLATPAFAQAPADDSDAPADMDVPVKPSSPARRAPPPRTPAPAKPAAPAIRSEAPAATPGGKPAVTAQDVRPPANILIDCAKAPKEAVTKLPDDLARWATIYCTKLGNVFNANDQHVGAFPDSGLRASFSAAEMAGQSGEPGNDAYFTSIAYSELSPADRDALIALDPSVRRILVGKSLWRLALTAKGGETLSFLVIDPTADLFWVFPLNSKGIDKPAFYVTSLETLNKAR